MVETSDNRVNFIGLAHLCRVNKIERDGANLAVNLCDRARYIYEPSYDQPYFSHRVTVPESFVFGWLQITAGSSP